MTRHRICPGCNGRGETIRLSGAGARQCPLCRGRRRIPARPTREVSLQRRRIFAANVRAARERAGLRVADVARRGVPESTMREYELGTRVASGQFLLALAQALQCDPTDLAPWEGGEK